MFTVYMLFGGEKNLRVRRRDETSKHFLQEKIQTLLPWYPEQALSDISSLCVRSGESSGLRGGWSHCRGTVQSLNNRRDAWLAYIVNAYKQVGEDCDAYLR